MPAKQGKRAAALAALKAALGAEARQGPKTAPQASRASAKPPTQPPKAASRAKAPPKAPADDPFDTARSPKAPPAADPFDAAPSARRIPGVYVGRRPSRDGGDRCVAIAYREGEDALIHAIVMGQPIRIQSWDLKTWSSDMRPMDYNGGGHYPMDRAVGIYLKSFNPRTDAAQRVLKKLEAGGTPTLEDETVADGTIAPQQTEWGPRITHQPRSKQQRLEMRRKKRQERLAAMSPKEREAWKQARVMRRKQRRKERK